MNTLPSTPAGTLVTFTDSHRRNWRLGTLVTPFMHKRQTYQPDCGDARQGPW
jgi:hypothetical protein